MAYGYIGISPLVNQPLRYDTFNVILVVVPGFGVIYKLSREKTNQISYIEFMRNAFRIIRSYICTDDTCIGLVQDNARYHTTNYTNESLREMKVDVFPIVPYSPQLNEPAEACFGYCKNNIEIYVPDPNNKASSNEMGHIIIEKWEKVISKFDGAMSAKYYFM